MDVHAYTAAVRIHPTPCAPTVRDDKTKLNKTTNSRQHQNRLHTTAVVLLSSHISAKKTMRNNFKSHTHLVDLLVPAVVPRPRVPLAVLVGHDRSQGVVHRLGREVLRGDEDQAVPLTDLVVVDKWREERRERS